jgi:tripartite-type tricarboxylate transporter receptor subunit TctC
MTPRRFLKSMAALGALALAGAFTAAPAVAGYPDKPIRWIVPFPPGGAMDGIARVLGETLAQRFGQPVVKVKPRSIQDLITEARAQPGKLTYACAGVGTSIHLAGALFNAMAGVDIQHVPYRGSGPAAADLLGGHVHMMFDSIAPARPHVQSRMAGSQLAVLPETSHLGPVEQPEAFGSLVDDFIQTVEARTSLAGTCS